MLDLWSWTADRPVKPTNPVTPGVVLLDSCGET